MVQKGIPSEYLFKSDTVKKMSNIHLSYVGGKVCFHLRRIDRLTKIVVKATTLISWAVRPGLRDTPKRANKSSGSILLLRALLSISNTPDQKVASCGHVQNIGR